ncbi:hypothetical protein HanLR1_Chr02g0045531 [Helianthus annuus]|nr:hypothetical protein HanLR1_Chr02g0045531 [Helianthus annuus]
MYFCEISNLANQKFITVKDATCAFHNLCCRKPDLTSCTSVSLIQTPSIKFIDSLCFG